MKVASISLLAALNFPVITTAFQFYSKDVNDGHITSACAKALKAKIVCDDYVPHMNLNHYQKWVGDVELADKICTDSCSESFRSWNDTVTKDCAEDMKEADYYHMGFFISNVGYIWQGFNETCLKDDESGRYCQEIIDGFSDIPKKQERPFEELCHPCYGKLLTAMSKSFLWFASENYIFSSTDNYWKGQLDLVHEKCGGSNSTTTQSQSPTETPFQDWTGGPTPDGPTDPGIPSDCSWFQTIIQDMDNWDKFANDWAISLRKFVEYNPTIKDDCSGIQFGHSYCVEVNNGYPRKENSPGVTAIRPVEPQPTEDGELIPSQGSLKDAYKEFYKANKQAIMGKYRDLAGRSVSGEDKESAPGS
ncbi:hypothetical protein ACHAP5_006921 [Fusarium lateritium]